MLDSPIFQVIIGMIFIYSLLSIMVTQINSFFSAILKVRAKHLRHGISELVQDEELRAKIISHPLIRLTKDEMLLPKQKVDDETIQKVLTADLENITWIDSKTFVNVLVNLVRVSSDKELYGALLEIVDGMPDGEERRRLRRQINKVMDTGEGTDMLHKLVESLSDEAYRNAMKHTLKDIEVEITKIGLEDGDNIVSLMAGLRNIKNPYFRSAMDAILSTSGSLKEAEEKIENWFDDGMSRATTAFKNHMQRWSLITGLIIAILINVDTIFMAQTLWNDPILRATVADAAQANIDALEQAQADAEAAAANTNTENPLADAEQAAIELGETAQLLTSLQLPLGWGLQNPASIAAGEEVVPSMRNLWYILALNDPVSWGVWIVTKIIGLVLTMIAIAQGAPFWFGILRRLSGGAVG